MNAKKISFLLSFLMLFITLVSARMIRHGCPLLCNCNQTEIGIKVKCQSNHIKEIPQIAVNATQIYIKSNKINEIPNHAFYAAGNAIKILNFAKCKISTIEQDAFFDLRKMESLTLKYNELRKLPNAVLSPMLELKMIYLDENKLINFDSLCVLRNLREIHLTSNKLKSINFNSCFNTSFNLYFIDFSENDLSTIVSDDFYSLRNITLGELYLNGCNLTTIQNDTFMYLPKLKKLGLNNNHLTYLPLNVFKRQRDLLMLDLSNNKFHVLPMESLRPLLQLHELHIGGNNKITNFTLGPVFRTLKNLSRLDFSGQNLTHISNDTFKYLDKCPIYELILEQCSIRTIEPGAFAPISTYVKILKIYANPIDATALSSALYGLRNVSFNYLQFDHLDLKDLDQSTFRHLQNVNQLRKLSFDNSGITILRKNVFPAIEHLYILALNNNGLKIIEDGSLANISFIKALQLYGNSIDEFPSVKNGQLPPNIISLSLENNAIKSLTSQSFFGLKNLENIGLPNNKIKKLGKGCWESLESLEILDLKGNEIGSLSSFSGNLPNTLQYLNLAKNPIQNYNADFSNIYNLETLDLSKLGGKLENIFLVIKRLILPLFRLKNLYISKLALDHLDVETFKNNTDLEFLVLSDNRIQTWDPKLFSPLKQLQTLKLARNNIFYVTKASFLYLPSLQNLDLSKNLFHCDCKLEWFRNVFFYKDNILIENLQNDGAYTCKTPSNMENKNVLDFHVTKRECQTRTTLILVITVLSTFVGITFLISVVLRYRWYIRYWVYLLRVRRKQYIQHDQEETFLFDAFVSYNSKDSSWVIQKLLPALEYNGEFKICLYDRDWVVGANIAECVIESIENSRKTILVLSNNFAKSEWCQFELSLAHHKLLSDKIDVLVPILFSEIEDKNMTASMRGLLTQKIYLEWPQDKAKEERFWNGLKIALQKPQKRALRR